MQFEGLRRETGREVVERVVHGLNDGLFLAAQAGGTKEKRRTAEEGAKGHFHEGEVGFGLFGGDFFLIAHEVGNLGKKSGEMGARRRVQCDFVHRSIHQLEPAIPLDYTDAKRQVAHA